MHVLCATSKTHRPLSHCKCSDCSGQSLSPFPHTVNASPSPVLSKPLEVLPASLGEQRMGWEPASPMAATLREWGELWLCLAEAAPPVAAVHLCAGLRVSVAEPSGWHLLLEQLFLDSSGKREQARWECFIGQIWHIGWQLILTCKNGFLAQTKGPHGTVSCLWQ